MAGQTARIAILDDDEDNRILLADRLAAEGHEVVCSGPVEAGLARMRREPVVIAFLGLGVPDSPGDTALEVILALPSPPTVVVVAPYGGHDRAMAAVQRGAYDFVTRPLEAARLRIVMTKALERERLRRENARLSGADSGPRDKGDARETDTG